MSVEAISWVLNLAPVPVDRGGQPSSARTHPICPPKSGSTSRAAIETQEAPQTTLPPDVSFSLTGSEPSDTTHGI
jgi:hypothetical protein